MDLYKEGAFGDSTINSKRKWGEGFRYGTTPGNEKLVQSPFRRSTSVLVDGHPSPDGNATSMDG